MTGLHVPEGSQPLGVGEAARLREVADRHRQQDGRCPRCGTRARCWVRAWAVEGLTLAGEVA